MNKVSLNRTSNRGSFDPTAFFSQKKLERTHGRILHLAGIAVKVKDENSQKECYVKITDLVNELIGKDCNFSKKVRSLIKQRIMEIADPDTRKPLSSVKLEQLFRRFQEEKRAAPSEFRSGTVVLDTLDRLKDELSDIPLLHYSVNLNEIAHHLKPGDIIAKKNHEDNPNPVRTFQRFFSKHGYREAYKFSHTALYLGQFQGAHWIAESTIRETNDPEIRRVQLDDPRFELLDKNQYMIMRNMNEEQAIESARVAKNCSIKLIPKNERMPVKGDAKAVAKYSYLEAARSLWHSKRLGHFGLQRLLKHYADYQNQVPFEFLGKKRGFFCSHFVQMMQSLGEMKKSPSFQKFIEKHPPPKPNYVAKKGFARKLSKLWYSIRKGIWAKRLTVSYRKTLKKSLTLHLDAVRTTPQDAVNYMLDNKDKYKIIGITSRRQI